MTRADFCLYFRRFYPSLVLYTTKLLGNEDVEDVVQDAFIELWRRRDRFSCEAHIKSFLFRSVYTKSLNVIKHRYVIYGYAGEYLDIETRKLQYYNPDRNEVTVGLENNELRERIRQAIRQLPDKRRQVFVMSYLHDLSTKEIAQIMGISVRTVESHLYKALRFLRGRLGIIILWMLIFVLK